MNNQYNWQQIKYALLENFIEPDFKQFSTTTFTGIDFDKVLEIFRYILEQNYLTTMKHHLFLKNYTCMQKEFKIKIF